MAQEVGKITGETVRADFNAINAVLHYARAAHFLGLWESERLLIEKYSPDRGVRLLEAGCGAGRVAAGLGHLGYRNIIAFDFAEELLEQARNLAAEQGIAGLEFVHADATRLGDCHLLRDKAFDGVLFLFNGLMQIPGRENRRAALRGLHCVCQPGAPLIFTTHDRDEPRERAKWTEERERWVRGKQDPRLVEFGDRYFAHEHGQTFMHLPDREEILVELAGTGWTHVEDVMRDDLAIESRAVREFSDNCRFWVAKKS
jgi:ubiquinone/menaquinone biosynthesis C-methylase UbiE